MRKIIKTLDSIARDYFAPYRVTCDYGTYRLCWTEAEARSWLPACGPCATIADTYDYRALITRRQASV
jgi:hypothetical protein